MAPLFPKASGRLQWAVDAGATPGVVCEVGTQDGPLWVQAIGRLSREPSAPAMSPGTIFDLASLTKVIVTTTLAMAEVETGHIALDRPARDWLGPWPADSDAAITVRHLLCHASGLPAHMDLWRTAVSPVGMRDALRRVPPVLPPGRESVYSDIGFMILGEVIEAAAGDALDVLWQRRWPEGWPWLGFGPPVDWRRAIPPTEVDPATGVWLQGVVHDENARALGGVAAHAGAFGGAAAVGRFAADVIRTFQQATWLGSPATMRTFAAPCDVPGSSRALGWDTMRPTSSCGTRLSPTAIGHTGFTGTSLWIDWARNRYVVLLSNRVHPTRANDAFVAMRAGIHDAIIDDLETTGLR